MRAPLFLKPGDTVGIVAPAGKISRESIDQAMDVIRSWGLHVVLGKNILSPAHSYFSGSDSERLADLQEMLDRSDIHTVFCARGGYGLTRILDRVNFSKFLQQPKWIVGFSDITALHLKLQQLGVESIHGPMLLHLFKSEYNESAQRLKKMLFGEVEPIKVQANAMNRWGEAKGEMIGGNLSLIVDSLGTKTSPDTQNKILVIEEIGEYKYKIDRMFTQLKRSGKLDHLAALIIGHMTDIKDADPGFGESIEAIVLDKIKDHHYPVAFNFPMGHEAPNMAWRHGSQGSLIVSEAESVLRFNA
ncbi:MAG TPA: LD-carboxypeptidase [Cyclobacteriaceae bacterium]|jgi:muramoyltetrapeptide carboxypeptidase|nr:LD-carboxypeptidase [Cyclobacteriaceae bacterium]